MTDLKQTIKERIEAAQCAIAEQQEESDKHVANALREELKSVLGLDVQSSGSVYALPGTEIELHLANGDSLYGTYRGSKMPIWGWEEIALLLNEAPDEQQASRDLHCPLVNRQCIKEDCALYHHEDCSFRILADTAIYSTGVL